jgi:O-methyltransferase involved in polyketide biosynthesis
MGYMAEKISVELGNVQKTLFLPLWGRAVESQKENPMLVDAKAVEIIDQMDLDVSQLYEKMDDLSQIAWIQRSLIGDRMIGRFLEQHPEGPVVNIGCGLDTTFDRMNNGRVLWFDLDLPDVIELRKRFMDETDHRKFIAVSFLDEGWMDSIPAGGPVFFLAAGVFYYFEPDEIKAFLLRLLNRFPGSEILFDVSSPTGIKIANQKVIENSGLDERSYLKWGLKNKKDVLDWDPRLELIGAYYYFRNIKLSWRNSLMGALSDAMGVQYLLYLKLGEAE